MCQSILNHRPPPPHTPTRLPFHQVITFSVTDYSQRLGLHFDAFVRECRDVFDRMFSERMKVVIPKVIRSAIDVANTWPSRRRGDHLLTASSYRSACRKGLVCTIS